MTREMGADVIETITWFGGRDQINHVHFRNVVMKVPREVYVETFIDAGDQGRRGGWGDAIGQMKAMLRQIA